MTWSIIIALIVIGLLFLILEILVIPGTGVVGILGFALLVFAIYSTYASKGASAGHIALSGTVVLSLVSIIISIRAKTWDKMMLKSKIDSKVNKIDVDKIHVGDEGISISRIAPMGKARFSEEYFEVTSTGDFIDQNCPLVITKIEGTKIFVKLK